MTEVATINPPRTMMELFKSIPEGTLIQLIDNQIVISPAPTDTHQKVLGKIFKRIDDFVEGNDLAEVRIAPYDVFINETNAYQPDLVFIFKENTHKISEKGLTGVPDLVVEILSTHTSKYDKKGKKEVYEQEGVKEYFIVDPHEKSVTHYLLVNDEFHELAPTTGILKSNLLGADFKF